MKSAQIKRKFSLKAIRNLRKNASKMRARKQALQHIINEDTQIHKIEKEIEIVMIVPNNVKIKILQTL